MCTKAGQVEHQRCSRTGRVQKNHKFKENTQYLMNTLYLEYRTTMARHCRRNACPAAGSGQSFRSRGSRSSYPLSHHPVPHKGKMDNFDVLHFWARSVLCFVRPSATILKHRSVIFKNNFSFRGQDIFKNISNI